MVGRIPEVRIVPGTWSGDVPGLWAYLGRDYLRLSAHERRISGSRLDLSPLFPEASEKVRQDFLEWCSDQRIANNDSLAWWMNHAAGRNNAVSPLFMSVLQVTALNQSINSQDAGTYPSLTVICEDPYLEVAVRHALKGTVRTIGGTLRVFIRKGGYCAKALAKGSARLAVKEARLLRRWMIARENGLVRQAPNGDSIYIVHQCLDDRNLELPGPLR